MVGVNRRTDLSRLNHLRAASLKKFLSKADGARPLQRGVICRVVCRSEVVAARRQEEWYRKIFNYFVLEILSLYYF